MRTLVLLVEKISKAGGFFAALLVIPLLMVTCYEVAARYIFDAPTSWGYELGYMLTGLSFIFGCAYTLKEKGHIRIDVLYNRFPPKVRAALTAAGYIFLFLPVAWWLCHGLAGYAWEAWQSGEHTGQSAWNPPAWPLRFMLFAGFTLLALQATGECIKALYFLIRGRTLTGGPADEEF